MKKILLIAFLAIAVTGCQITFDPAGKLGEKRKTPTVTSTSELQVKAAPLRVPSPTVMISSCRVTGDLHMRAAPNPTAAIIDYFYAGQLVDSTGRIGDWRVVRNWAGTLGYAHAKWLECQQVLP